MLGDTIKTSFFTVRDIPAAQFIESYAQHLKKNNLITRPVWADFVKLSTRNELAPQDEDWLYYRIASLARKIYLRPHMGVALLSHVYGGLKRGGCKSERHEHAGKKVIRWGLKQLEQLKIIKKDKNKGNDLKLNSRIITKEGRKTLNRIATEWTKPKTA